MDNLFNLIQTLGKNLDNEITIRQLSKESKVPYTTTLRLIRKNQNLFIINKKGNIKLISLNIEDSITKNYLVISERKTRNEFIKNKGLYKTIINDLVKGGFSLILFGSRADNANREKSDVDLMIINKDGKKNLSFTKQETIFQIQINPIFMSKKEFKHMIKEKEHNLANEIIKKHIILYGEEYFWNVIYN